MRLLITGITGFVGSYMAEYALGQGAQVFGSSRWRSKTENIEHLRAKITLIESDLRDLSSVRMLLETAKPTHVVHLAAQSFVGASWQTPAETLSTNIISQVNLLEGIRGLKMSPRFLAVGSSEEYGLVYEGDLKPRRDYSDVRDIVRGYWLLLEQGEPGEVYNLCSGRSWAIQQVLDFLLEQATVKGITVKIDPARLRPSDVMNLEGDFSKMEKATGWRGEIPFERTLRDLLGYWRQRTWSSSR